MVLCASAMAQTGTEFWFVAPDVSSGHSDRPILLRISSYANPVTITISQPANNSFAPISVTLGSNETQSVDLTSRITDVENSPRNTVLNKGLLIESTDLISVYYEVKSNDYNTDIFTLKGENALGTDFVIPSQTYFVNSDNYTPAPYTGIDIVATEDNTVITVYPNWHYFAPSYLPYFLPFNITLDRGETYSLEATFIDFSWTLGSSVKLDGLAVTSTQPIAITLKDDSNENSNYGSCADLMGDQLVPTSRIGTEYIVVKGFLKNGSSARDDRIYITATQNNTSIYIDGSNTPVATINRGQQYEYTLSNASTHIEASNDVYVLHVTGFGCELGMALLPTLYCTGSGQVSFTRSRVEEFYLIILVPAGGQGQFKINGNKNLISASDFSNVPGTGGQWKQARIYFSDSDITTGSNYILSNSNTIFHAGIINGGDQTGTMYGYFTDFGNVTTELIYHF